MGGRQPGRLEPLADPGGLKGTCPSKHVIT